MDTDIVADRIQRYYHPHTQEIAFAAESVSFALRGEGQAKAHNDAIEFGRNFLEKLVQISITVPQLTRAGALDFVRRSGFVEEIVEIVTWAPAIEITNPRRLKRYLNWLSVSLQLIMAAHDLPERLDNAFALRALALRQSFRSIYDLLLLSQYGAPIIWPEQNKEADADVKFATYLDKLRSVPGLLRDFDDFLWRSNLFGVR
jgi:hypothetical protein